MALPVPGYGGYKPPAPPKPKPPPAWQGLNTQLKNVFGGDPYAGEQAAIGYGWSKGLANDPYYQASFYGNAGNQGMRSRRMVTPDYSGVLGSYTRDQEARFGAGKAAKQAQMLSQMRAAVNRLGVRDIPGMLAKLGKYGFTQADLQAAADNPWSELKAIDYNRKNQWANKVGGLASQGLFRSGATTDAQERLANEAARREAQLTEGTLSDVGEAAFGQQDWERTERDRLDQQAAAYQAQLAAAYQPYWIEE